MEKLRELRKINKLSMKELGNSLGLAESTISLYETGKREPDITTILKIADYFKVSVDELLGRKNSNEDLFNEEMRTAIRECHSPEMINFEKMCSELDEKTLDRIHTILYSLRRLQNNQNIYSREKQYLFACLAEMVGRVELFTDNFQSLQERGQITSADISAFNKRFLNAEIDILKDIIETVVPAQENTPSKKQVILPLYEISASAGTGSWLDNDVPVTYQTIEKSKQSEKADFIIKVQGDSMQPKFFDGDAVLVQQSTVIDEGEIGVFILNSESYIKKMGRGELISLNPAYKPIKFKEYDDVRCVGKVIDTVVL